VITGESGAGKSIILEAVDFLMGINSGKEYLINDFQECYVEAMFEIDPEIILTIKEENDFFDFLGEQIIISRRFTQKGKNYYYVDNRQIKREYIRILRNRIIESCYRDESLSAYSSEGLLSLIDSLIDSSLKKKLFEQIRHSFEDYIVLKKKIDNMKEKRNEMLKKYDYLKFQKQEIEESGLLECNQEEIENEYELLANYDLVNNAFSDIINILDSTDIVRRLLHNVRAVEKLRNLPQNVNHLLEKINFFSDELSEFRSEVENFVNLMEFDSKRLKLLEEKMSKIMEFQKKYASDLNELGKYYSDLQKEMIELENNISLDDNSPELSEKKEKYFLHATKLSNERKKIANKLISKFMKNLSLLGLKGIKSSLKWEETKPGNKGNDRVTLMFSANPDIEMKSVDKIASFGEKSRIILAIKEAAKRETSMVLLVDEIEAGLGGDALLKAIKMLESISKDTQIIAVTHNKRLAEIADTHFLVEKNTQDGKTILSINKLETSFVRKKELKRMSV